MPRPIKIDNATRLSVVISQEQLEWIKKMALRMSTIEGRHIPISEAVRMAIETAYPLPMNQTDFIEQ